MITLARVTGLITIQDLGRPGHMHEGLSRGGALVPELLARANRAAGNPDEAAALEVMGRVIVRATAEVELGTEDGARVLVPGDEHELVSEPHRVAYLALRGGIETPVILGSRCAHLCARLGRPLQSGDVVTAAKAARVEAFPVPFVERTPIRVMAGPDLHAFTADALETLTSAPYRILPASDRIGTRLSGPVLSRTPALDVSRPLVIGALEVPRDGQPIALGPEHPTTGGYPVIAVILSEDLGAFHALRLGGSVRFRVSP